MANHLPVYGWNPFILTASNARCHRTDYKLLDNLRHVKSFRAHQLYPLRKGDFLFAKGFRKIWNSLSPIDEHAGWVPFAISKGQEIIKKHLIDAIFVTGYPFSSFIVGLALKRRTGLPLFLDYRDPWTSNPSFARGINRRLSSRLERVCLESCDLYFGATPGIIEDISRRHSYIPKARGRVFTYSFDLNEFPPPEDAQQASNKVNLLSIGQTYDKQVGDNFIQAVFRLLDERIIFRNNFKLECYGKLNLTRPIDADKKDLISINPYIPHQEILKKMAECSGLVLLHGSGPTVEMCYPGRMFEYFAVKKPILYIGPNGIAAETIKKSGFGACAKNDDLNDVMEKTSDFISKVRNGDFQGDTDFINVFESKNVIKKFADDIGQIMMNAPSVRHSG
jgi:hypothetical protein